MTMRKIGRLDELPPIPTAEAAGAADIAALLAAGEPVVIPDAATRWPAVRAAATSARGLDAYLRSFGPDITVPVMEAPASARGRYGYAPDLREFSFTRRERPLSETLERMARNEGNADAPCIAIQMLPLDTRLPGFVAANPMPLVPPGASPKLWLGGPVRTQIHHDRDHNLACVIAGHRRFVLFPPDQVVNLYIGPMDNPPPLSLVDPEAPDLKRFPRFADALATARVAHLGPGDAILMPRLWWHHVTSLDRYNAMVNYWWGGTPHGPENAGDCFLSALIAIKHLPPPERRYWQAMFAAHVFADDEAAVEHVPAALRGPLGAMRPFEREALKRRLQALRGQANRR